MDDKKPFNQTEYMRDWQKKNMLSVSSRYSREFVEQFREALKVTGQSQSDVIRKAMQEVIDQAKNK
ncbi:MAG: hypothetical protein ACLTJG_15545 [[Clostridium] innocuum]